MPTSSRVSWVVVGAVIGCSLALAAAEREGSGDAELQFQLASLLYDETRYGEALQAFERAEQTADAALGIRARKGRIRSALKVAEFGLARQQAQKLVEQAQADAEAHTLFADTLWSAGLFDEADRAYKTALALAPGDPRARYGVARSLATQSKLTEALDEALAASATAPRDGEIHAAIGDIYERLNRFDEAANAYTNYINLLPNKDRSEKAAWARSQVQFLESFEGMRPVDVDEEDLRTLHTIPFRLV
jgi:Flp pilus assembly protein TadD